MRAVLTSLVFLSACGLLPTGGREFYSCPPLQDDVAGICSDECSDDTDCQTSEKCCSNGCGHTCTGAFRIPYHDPPANADGASVCPILHDQISNRSLIGSYIPQCSADGSFSPIQCHGSTGYCWCVHVQTGEPVSEVTQFTRPQCTNCTYRGGVYYTGQTLPASSNPADCNRCTCLSDGSMTCTQMPVPCPTTTTPPPVVEQFSCPPVDDDVVGICSEECSGDSDCTGGQKCCSNGCGHTCRTPVTIPHIPPLPSHTTPPPAVEQFFSCPPVDDDVVGICSEECSGDSDCTGGQKCCSNGCGHTCRTPVTIPHIPPRPLTTCPERSDVPCLESAVGGSCQHSGCGEGMMCCENLCASAVCLTGNERPCQSILDQKNQSAVLLGEYIPQCDGGGLFQSLQCHSHYCWCVDASSGRPTSDISPSDDLDGLDCSATTSAGCTFNGQQFANGDTVESINGCPTCFCSGGMVVCAESQSLCGGLIDDSDVAWWPVLLIAGCVVAIILTIVTVIMVVVVVVLIRRNKFHHRRLKETTSFTSFQDADVDFKEGMESIELKVPVEDSEPVKT